MEHISTQWLTMVLLVTAVILILPISLVIMWKVPGKKQDKKN